MHGAASDRSEQETGRNLDMMQLTHRLQPDSTNIARDCKDKLVHSDRVPPIRRAVPQSRPFSRAVGAINDSKFKAALTRGT